MTRLRVAHTAHGAGNCPILMAGARGYFAAEGVEVVRAVGPSTAPLVRSLAGGECDIAITAGVPVLRAAAAGVGPRLVASLVSRNLFAVVARPGTGWDDLRGARIGVAGPMDQDGIVMRRALREHGIDEGAVEIVALDDRKRLWDGLAGGDIAAFAVTPPLSIRAELEGFAILHDYAPSSGPYQLGSVVTTAAFLDAAPDAVEGFLRGLARGVAAFRASADEAMEGLRQCTGLTDERVLRATHAVFARAMARARPDPAALGAVLADLEAAEGRALGVDAGAIVTAAPFDAARAALAAAAGGAP